MVQKEERSQPSVVAQINKIYKCRDFLEAKFDLKETLCIGLDFHPKSVSNEDGSSEKGYQKGLNRGGGDREEGNRNNDYLKAKKKKRTRVKSVDIIGKYSKHMPLGKKKRLFVDQMVARSYLKEIKKLSQLP